MGWCGVRIEVKSREPGSFGFRNGGDIAADGRMTHAMWKGPRSGDDRGYRVATRRCAKLKSAVALSGFRGARSWSGDFCRGGAEYFAFVGFLDESDDAQVFGIGAGFQFQDDVLAEGLPFVELADLFQFFNDRDVLELFARIFSSGDL